MIEVVDVTIISSKGRSREKRKIIKEVPLEIRVNGSEFAVLQCSPADMEYLTVGFLLSEGLINREASIKGLEVREEELGYVAEVNVVGTKEVLPRRHIASAGVSFYEGVGETVISVDSSLRVRGKVLHKTMESFGEMSAVYKESGGNHSAGLSTGEGNIVLFFEDIGRHNCVDKILGKCFLEGIATSDKVMLLSGRVSVEMVNKVAKGGVPIITAFGSPTSMSANALETLNMAVCWYRKEGNVLLFGREERVI